MLYKYLQLLMRLTFFLGFKKINITNKAVFKLKGPLLLCVNHPNAFFDAMILGGLFRRKIYYLARGDVFKNGTGAKLLNAIGIIPIYRLSEGLENLEKNQDTFDICLKLLNQGEIVLIFSEGLCQNEWKLRSLKKGTARIALMAWESQGLANQTRILPIGLNYHNFQGLNKIMQINIGNILEKKDFNLSDNPARNLNIFNEFLFLNLHPLVIEDPNAKDTSLEVIKAAYNNIPPNKPQRTSIGFLSKLIHYPPYFLARTIARKKTLGTVFYDSIFYALLMFLFPIYWILLTILIYFFSQTRPNPTEAFFLSLAILFLTIFSLSLNSKSTL